LKTTQPPLSAPEAEALQVSTVRATLLPAREGRGRRRHALLRRGLTRADMLAGAVTGLVTAAGFGLAPVALVAFAVAVLVSWPLTTFFCGVAGVDDLRTWSSGVTETPRIILGSWLLSWPLYGALVWLGASHPAWAALTAAILLAGTTILSRTMSRAAIHRRPDLKQQTLIIGSGVVAARVVQRLHDHEEAGLDVVGYLDDGEHPAMGDVPRLGELAALRSLIHAGHVDRVVIAFTRASHEDLLRVIRICRDAGITVDVVPRLFDFLDGARVLDQVGSMPLLSIGAPTLPWGSRAAKRALDVAGASLGILVLAPILLAIAIAIRLDSRGPVLFVQRRPGRRGEPFSVLKFRTMHPTAMTLISSTGALVKQRHDERVTRVGRVLRRLSLDEAPQLFNVLRGDMSLVGPRPLVAGEAARLDRNWQMRRGDLRPGLTGPWQISGRSNIPLDERLAIDYQYVTGWSLARDLEILVATVPAVLFGRGAY
jgi:exopolysaccharide biosynthesis polyprenyl glycosylphosphotransferase